MNSPSINYMKLAELTMKKLLSLPIEDQEIALAMVFKEVYDHGGSDFQQKLLMSLPRVNDDTQH